MFLLSCTFYDGKPHQSLVHPSIFVVTLFTCFLLLMSVPCILHYIQCIFIGNETDICDLTFSSEVSQVPVCKGFCSLQHKLLFLI